MKIGVIDIGSNSIRTMTATLQNDEIACSGKQVFTTRLAEGLIASGRLSDARMEQSLSVIAQFCETMRAQGAPVYAYATSAVRDASNRGAFVQKVLAAGADIAVLTGEEEAQFAFSAATGGTGAMLDIGGGSTQLVSKNAAVSVPLGCVRAKDICGDATSLAAIRRALLPVLDQSFACNAFAGISKWSGVGGTITTLAAYALDCRAYDKHAVQNKNVSYTILKDALTGLDGIPLRQRAQIPLLRRRFDVILHGGTILLYLMAQLKIDSLRISDADGMEGYARHILQQ